MYCQESSPEPCRDDYTMVTSSCPFPESYNLVIVWWQTACFSGWELWINQQSSMKGPQSDQGSSPHDCCIWKKDSFFRLLLNALVGFRMWFLFRSWDHSWVFSALRWFSIAEQVMKSSSWCGLQGWDKMLHCTMSSRWRVSPGLTLRSGRFLCNTQ